MMIWVCRAGKKSVFYDYFLESSRIYIPWDGFKKALTLFANREEMKALVIDEKGNVARTSVSNWAGQLYSFCREMRIEDYVLIPYQNSKKFTLAKISGDYTFDAKGKNKLWHSRCIEIIYEGIPADIFDQSIRYSLGAYRTIFKARDGILPVINNYIAEKEG